MHNIGFRWYISGWTVTKQFVCLILTVYCEAMSKGNTLMKFNRNSKRLRGSYNNLYDIKYILLAFGGI